MKLSTRAFFLAGLALSLAGSFVLASLCLAEDAGKEWTEEDTRMANQYVRLLEARPEYSKVLDLLWEHYESHEATGLLLRHFKASAEASGATPQVRLVYAHLLRKSGDLPLARLRYEQLVNDPAIRPIVLLGLADLARELLPNPAASETYLDKLSREPGINPELIRESMRALADVYSERGNPRAALRVWRRLIDRFPEDLGMLQDLAARMIAAGFLKDAIEIYDGLREDPDPEKRVAVLAELGRLHELADDFDGAAAALSEGREATHFRHHTHLEFLSLLVRLYERQGRLEELEAKFVAAAGGRRPEEKALYTVVRFYEMIASPNKRQKWLRKLVNTAPGRSEYRQELVEVLLSNDRYEDAKKVLEELLAANVEETLELRLLRVQIELSIEGRDAGAALLVEYLVGCELGDQERGDVLRFAEENYLDEIAENLLREDLGADSDEAVFSLVNLHYSRGRLAEARAVLANHVELASDDAGERAERLFKVASALGNMDLMDEAVESLRQAVALQPGNLKYVIRLAELQSDAMKIDAALEQYELAWQLCETADDRQDIDQRIFGLLQLSDLQSGNAGGQGAIPFRPPSLNEPGRDNLARFLRAQGLTDEEPDGAAAGRNRLYQFYAGLRDRAIEDAAPDLQLRAAWWAHRVGDFATAYRFLEAFRDTNPNHLRAERLLLEVAVSSGDDHLALRQLDLLSKIDGERKMEYALRRAQLRLRRGDEKQRDEALQALAGIAEDEATAAGVLANLAQLYERLGRVDEALKIYRRAFAKSSLHVKRTLIIELNRLQVQTGAIDGALEAMTDLIREEHDVLQRRKELSSQVTLAMRHQRLAELEKTYETLQRKHPLESFYAEALALVYENAGKPREAFATIKKAYYSARKRDAHLLERMRHLAAETKDVNAAIYYQRQLVAVPDNRAEAAEWHKLVRMLELDFQVHEADRIRLRLESKFAQDPDVLGELVRYYLDARQPSAARRVLGRMVRLRPWDVVSLLTLGILEREAGQPEEAAKRFFLVLKHTRESAAAAAAQKPGEELARFPLRGFSRDARPGLMNRRKSLERLVEAIDEVRLVDNRLRVQIAQYLESGRPEFLDVPDQPGIQRLRAIEELGEITARSNDQKLLGRWRGYWKRNPPAAGEEELWVAWCGGDWPRAWDLLRAALADSQAGPGEFFLCLYGARMNRVPQLLDWIAESSATSGARQRRLTWLLSALYLLARDPATFPPQDQLSAFFGDSHVTSLHTYTLLNLLHKEGKVRDALRVGEIAREQGRVIEGFFDGSLALLAGACGESAKQRMYLRIAVEKIDPSASQFQEAVVGLYALLENDDERRALLEWAVGRLAEAQESSRTAFGKAWILALAGETEAATSAFRNVVSLHLDQAKLVGASLTGTFITESSQWMSLFDYAHQSRRLGFSGMARAPFLEALHRYDLVAPRTDESAAQFQQFQHYLFQQLLWEFEGLPFTERKARLRSYQSLFRGTDDWESFARTLGGEGFHRDTVPIYKELLYANPLDNDYSRAFFTACEKAREFEPALEYLNLLLTKEIEEPEGASGDYFLGQHALFLSMARNLERLEVFAEEQLNVGPQLSPSDRHYHHALAALLSDAGRLEEAARIYAKIDDGKHRALPLLRDHAWILRDLERNDAAIALLERVEPGNPVSSSDRLLIGDLAPLYAANGEVEKLRGLAARALDHPDEALSVAVAEDLLSAGMESEAESLLLLAMRRTRGDAPRLRLLVPAIGIALDSPSFERVAPLLEMFFSCDRSDAENETPRLIELIRDAAGGRHAASLRVFLEENEKAPRTATIARTCLVELELASPSSATPDRLRVLVERLIRPGASAAELEIALKSCLAHASGAEAGRLMTALRERRARVFDHAALAVRVHGALGENAAIAALFQQLTRQRNDNFATLKAKVEIAEAFAAIGETEKAARLYRLFYNQLPSLGSANSEFVESYSAFLVNHGAFFEAENLLLRGFRKSAAFDPALIVDLYDRWGRLDGLTGELPKFDLSSGLVKEVEFLAERRRIGEGESSESAVR